MGLAAQDVPPQLDPLQVEPDQIGTLMSKVQRRWFMMFILAEAL